MTYYDTLLANEDFIFATSDPEVDPCDHGDYCTRSAARWQKMTLEQQAAEREKDEAQIQETYLSLCNEALAKWDAIEKTYRQFIYADLEDEQFEAVFAQYEQNLTEWHCLYDWLYARSEKFDSAKDLPMSEMPFPVPQQPARTAAPEPRIRPRRVSAASFDGKSAPEREWLVQGLIPTRNVTLLYGDGGTGKSLLALQLGAAVSASTHFFGRPVIPGGVEFVTAEDSIEELHRRLVDVTRAMQKSPADLSKLHLTSLADEDALLAVPEDGRGGSLVATTLYVELNSLLSESRPTLLVLDTLADVYGGDENWRAQVRQFVGMLRRLALKHDCAVLVLAHPSLAGMEKGTSGSTGWSNSVRSRLYFARVFESDGTESDEDVRILRVQKSNYGRVGLEIGVRWSEGVFVPLATSIGGDPIMQRAKAERVFLDLLAKHTAQNRPVSVTPGHGYAPKAFEGEARAQGVRKHELASAMGRLLDSGRIKNVEHGPPSRRYRRLEVATPNLPVPPC